MKIHYLDMDSKGKLFSFHKNNHETREIEGKEYMIDGGFYYVKHSINGTIKDDEIKDLIKDIREQFTWGKNFDENNNKLPETEYALLKDLTSSHISFF